MLRNCLALLLLVSPFAARAQGTSPLVGDWRLVTIVRPDSAGGASLYWGPRPLGIIRYSANGVMSAQLYDERRAGLGVREWTQATPEAARTALIGLATYYGTYAVDTVAHTVTHRVEGAMDPDWIGRSLVRGYRFLPGNLVELRVITGPDGRPTTNGVVLVWERIPDSAPHAP